MTDRTGQQLGNYNLTRLLGRGGFAEVYLSQHIYLKTQAAIKVLLTQLSGDDMEVFLNEARTIANLIHPNIVRVLDFGVDGTTPFLVMDYAPSGTLRQRHPKGFLLEPAVIVPYIKQIAAGLQYAHDQKLIHRDIKPENLLVGRQNEILLSDFGIALVAQSSRYQSTQDVVGTVAYMSPEQIQGKPRPASDQYSLGIVVYEWLTRDRPFHGSFTELCAQHMFASPPPLCVKNPMISPAIENVVNTALAKDPHQRFPTVQTFANAFEQASRNEERIATFVKPQPILKPTMPMSLQAAPPITATMPILQATHPLLPANRARKTLTISLGAGIIAALQVIIFTLANASLYNDAANAKNANNISLGVASTIVSLFFLTSFISLVIYFIAGFITGKVAVERRMGFLGGFVAGAVAYATGFIVQYFPGYPGAHNTGFSGGLIGFGGGLITALIILVLLALLAGLFGFLGAWLATRRHP